MTPTMTPMVTSTLAPAATHTTRSTCPYCGVGCGVLIEHDGTHISGVRGDPEHPANYGRLCSKGASLHQTATVEIHRQTRVLHPQWRSHTSGPWQALGWNAALDMAAQRIASTVQQHGPDSVGFYLSGQLLTEDYYVFNKLAKGLLQTNNLDTNSRLCMSSAVAGYKKSLGADAPPPCYDDIALAQCLFITGSNTAFAHPILFRRIEDAKRANPAMKIIVCDPRRTDTAELADLYLPLLPGTDVLLYQGMLRIMLDEGWLDTDFIAQHTEGFDALQQSVADLEPATVAAACGIGLDDLLQATRWFAGVDSGSRSPTLSLYCMGLNQSSHGTDKNTALINLHLACGQIGIPGAGPFSLTGQPNAMGGREVGGLSNLLSAHRDMANPEHRAEVAALWGVPNVPSQPGLSAIDMFQAAADGQIKVLWIACTNPAQSLPDQKLVQAALQRCELVVLQEAFATTATARYAHLLLPATTWGEKDGTVTNSERRISRVRTAVPPPVLLPADAPEALTATADTLADYAPRHDWAIAAALGQRLQALLHPDWPTLFDYPSPESVWNEHRASTRGRDLDITGLSYAALEQAPQQWPCPAGESTGLAQGQVQGTVRLYTDHRFATPNGKARFITTPYLSVAEETDARYPIALTTGRLRDQWHGMSRTGNVARLYAHQTEPVLQLHPLEVERLGLRDGALARVRSRRGELVLPVLSSPDLGRNQAFVAMHWGIECLNGGVNLLTNPRYCPDSKQPELKHSAVAVSAVAPTELPWQLSAMVLCGPDTLHTTRQALQACMQDLQYASCVLATGPAGDAVVLRAAHTTSPASPTGSANGLLERLQSVLGLPHSAVGMALAASQESSQANTASYSDAQRGLWRQIRWDTGTKHSALSATQTTPALQAFLLVGPQAAPASTHDWMAQLLLQATPIGPLAAALLRGVPGENVAAPSPTVCSCEGVRQDAIEQALTHMLHVAPATSAEQQLQQLKDTLRCGTGCGSCVPQLQRLIRIH
ncbi:molybdopterin-dependent oxidoreductase [Curvibacter sp. CHRR-16]|uniref:nitrate reductase n=1 Tax=Curvibacter sp. CHRR-16 TaxID=2835872 RepID=UPI001BDA952C|nr:nitrate reductase [Curvibacter sp. CHRR-16]MBT0570805.1 molybdopterin-dependent oxidoreductase [Curvibacter sp. CHRR-16]